MCAQVSFRKLCGVISHPYEIVIFLKNKRRIHGLKIAFRQREKKSV